MNGIQCRVARAYLGWTLDDLARRLRGKVARRTLVDFEADTRKPQKATAEAIETVLTAHGTLLDPDGVNVRYQPKRK